MLRDTQSLVDADNKIDRLSTFLMRRYAEESYELTTTGHDFMPAFTVMPTNKQPTGRLTSQLDRMPPLIKARAN